MGHKTHFALFILLPPLFAFIHWIGVRIYSNYCSPPGFVGIVTSIFNTANPFCSYILELLGQTKNFYMNSWIVIGAASYGVLNMIYTKCKNATECSSTSDK
jgi:hypothetical protein